MTEKTKELPAIQVSVATVIGDNHQLQLAWYLDPASTEDEQNAALDKLGRLADRQKAKYRVVDLRKDLVKHKTTLAQFREDLARVDGEHVKRIAETDVAIEAVNKAKSKNYDEGASEHAAKGSPIPYELRGGRLAEDNRLKAVLAKIDGDKQKLTAERDVAMQSLEVSIKRYLEQIALLEEQIADCEKLI